MFCTTSGRGMSDDIIEEKWRRGTGGILDSKEGTEAYPESDPASTLQNKYGLDYFQSSMFATILEDSITQLRILAECNNELRVIKTHTDIDKLRAVKYFVKQPEVQDELEGVDRSNIDAKNYKLDKLENDKLAENALKLIAKSKKFVINALLSTYLDLSLKRNCRTLQEKTQAILGVDIRRLALAEEETRKRLTRRELMRQLRQQRNHVKSVTYDTDAIIDNLKSQVEDAALNSEIQGRYIDNWQRARSEQQAQSINNVESAPADAIENYKQSIDREQRVHTEVELLISININETLQKIETLMSKYDKDIESLEIKIQKKKLEHEKTVERRQILEKTVERHEQLTKDWLNFKEQREKARQHLEMMHRSATIVQAWWRGLLVRNELGPYKPTKQPVKLEKPNKKGKKRK